MVDSVNSTNGAKLRLQSVQTGGTTVGKDTAASSGNVKAVDNARLSDQASVQMIKTLAENGPPFDAENVTRIKQALSEGRYPVDSQRITDSIFQDYNALMR
ncbi:MAG: flagellar biosynthesis anti-sigma factor FlgM [Roseovarius gahaiensis]